MPIEGPLTVMCAPLLVGTGDEQRLLGSLEAWRIGGSRPFGEADLAAGMYVARQTALVTENARQIAVLRHRVEELQADLLPPPRRETTALSAAGAYRSGGPPAAAEVVGGEVVGGGWYDSIPLAGGRVALVAGAVPGYGQHVVAAMGQIRRSTEILAKQDWEPAELLARLDVTVAEAGAPLVGSQCLCVVVDPVERRLQAASAGRLAPLLVRPDGGADVLSLLPGPPLGSGTRGLYMATHHPLPPGSTLALTTADSTREQRHLLGVAADGAGRGDSPGVIAASLVAAAGPGDATALAAAIRELPAGHHATWTWPAEARAAGEARRVLPGFLQRLDPGMVTDDLDYGLTMAVSELVTNAYRYGSHHSDGHSVTLRLIVADGRLTAEVDDPASAAPQLRLAGVDEEGGRGIKIVHQLGTRWGTRYRAEPAGGKSLGKTIWVQFALGETGGNGPAGEDNAPEPDLDALADQFPEP